MDQLPWWQVRMYCEGLNEEFKPYNEDDDSDTSPSGGGEVHRTDDLASLGFNITPI